MTTRDPTAYYAQATSWALDEQEAARGSIRRARLVAGAAVLVAVIEGLALLLLTPLKTVTAVPILVDRQTGFVETLAPNGRKELEANEALVQSLLAQYVVARESFNITSLSADYHKVALWSGGSARRDYLTLMPANNAESPLRLYPRTTIVDASVKSVSRLGPNSALVRFETRRWDQDAPPSEPEEWAAVVGYRFSNEGLSAADRWINPLCFQVVSYQRDPEVLPPVLPPTRTSATAPTDASPAASNAAASNALAAQPTGRKP